MSPLFSIWHNIQHTLFPWLEDELDPLTEKQQEFIRVIELAEIQKHIKPYRWQGVERKRDDRLAILMAFVAKAVKEPKRLVIIGQKSCQKHRKKQGQAIERIQQCRSKFSCL